MEHTPHLKFWCICILAPTPPPQDLGNATSSVELERKVRGRAGQGRVSRGASSLTLLRWLDVGLGYSWRRRAAHQH